MFNKDRHPYALSCLIRVMKLTTFFLLITFITVNASVYSQVTKLDLKVQSLTVKEVLSRIEDQSQFFFMYNDRKIDVERKIDLDLRQAKIEDLLKTIFDGTNTRFIIKDRQIVLYNENDEEFRAPNNESASQQQKSVSGKVTDSSGAALPGVSVVVKGTTTGVITDMDGKYVLSRVSENATLLFSFVGMKSKEILIEGKNLINVTLVEDAIGIEEVVAVGYGTQKKVNLTGAVSQVDSKVLESRPITNLGQGLQGMVANLNISPVSGAPGRGVSFNIRGTTSINGGDPLVLVDGVQMNPNLINPQDIKSISVLKDAASASIYGARAAYGVILISTKNGMRSQKPIISFSSNYSINKPTVVPEYMNSKEYSSWMNQGYLNTNGRAYFDQETMQHIDAYYNDPQNNLPVFHYSTDLPNIYRYCGNTNWTKELLKESYPMQQYNASINGGSEKVSYYTSFGYFNQKGISKPGNENYDRYNFMQNLNYDVNSWLNLSVKASVNSYKNKMNPNNKGGGYSSDNIYISQDSRPLMPVYHPDGHFSGMGSFTNMVAFIEQGGFQEDKVTDVWLTGAIKLTPMKSLTINIDYTHNSYNDVFLNYMKEYYDYDANGKPYAVFPHTSPNAVTRTNTNNNYSSFNAYAEYDKNLNNVHHIKVLVGLNQELGLYNWFQAQRQKLISNEIPFMNLASGDKYAYDSATEYGIRGVFTRVNYILNEKYLFEFNGRYDGSSRFPKNDRFAFFPSGSLGWRISNESFFESLKNTVNDLKIRASYGSLGNQAANTYNQATAYNQAVNPYYPYVATFGTNEVDYLFGNEKLMSVSAPGLVSPTLTWEKVMQYNFGVDFSLINSKLQGSFDIYRRDTKDMLTKSKSLPSILGTSEPQANAADMKTSGFDFTLSYNNVLENGLKYGLNLILSDSQSEITKYDNPNGVISDYYVGKKIGEIWGFVTKGLFKTDQEASQLDQSQISGHKFLAGDIEFKDLTNDNKITRGSQTITDHGDLTIIGNSSPRYSYGLKANAEWKGFDFDIFFQGIGKRDMNVGNTYFLAHYGSQWAVPQKINTDYWSESNPDAFFPRPRIGNANEVSQIQTRFLQNAAYLRLKELTIGYTFPKSITQKAGIDNLRIYFSGSNLWEYTKMLKIFDPEVNSTQTYPFTRSFSLGMNISL